MRSRTAFALISILAVVLPACGKYGPPVRTVVPQETRPQPGVTRTVPQVPEETLPDPAEFDEAVTEEETVP